MSQNLHTRPRTAVLLAVALGLGGSSCTNYGSWTEARTQLIEPVNQTLHREYHTVLRQGDIDAFVAMHSEASRATARRDAEALTAAFRRVERSACNIHRVEQTSLTSLSAEVELHLQGQATDGSAHSLVQVRSLTLQLEDAGWRIVETAPGDTRTWDDTGLRFRETATARGLEFAHASCGVEDVCGEIQPYLPGAGVTAGDVDGDGDDDLVYVGGRDVSVFINDGGTFSNDDLLRGLEELPSGEARYSILADIDNDGDQDLFIGVLDGPHQLFENVSDGQFRRTPGAERGIVDLGETTGACFADFDGDGDLDLFIANGGNLLRQDPEPIYAADNGAPNQLFLNDGHGHFIDVSDDADIDDTGWALACTTTDIDGDGLVDIYVANDFGTDRLYRNNGDGTFDDIADDLGIEHRGSSMGVSFGDIDNDGDIDAFVTGMASNSAWILDLPTFPAPAPWLVRVLFRGEVIKTMREMLHGNRFYLNDGEGHFEEVSVATGTRNAGWAWGGVFFDADNDGRQDLYVLNGLVSGEVKDDL